VFAEGPRDPRRTAMAAVGRDGHGDRLPDLPGALGSSERCSVEANSASARAALTLR